MFICEKRGTKKRILNIKNNTCKKCGNNNFTMQEMANTIKVFNNIINNKIKL